MATRVHLLCREALEVKILGISGSLRSGSINTALLEAAQIIAPDQIELRLAHGTGELPHFNPDLEPAMPLSVTAWRQQIGWAHAFIISSPEYAHGTPGSLKNALDWLVSTPLFTGKPIAIIGVTNRGLYARASLIEVVTTMDGRVIDEASVMLAVGRNLTALEIAADAGMAEQLRSAVLALALAGAV